MSSTSNFVIGIFLQKAEFHELCTLIYLEYASV
jgi:hypothetical protein